MSSEIQGRDHLMSDLMGIMKLEVESAAEGFTSLVPVIVGDPGIGKSASLKNMAEEMNYDSFIISLGALPMEWFSGLPDFAIETMDAEYSLEGKTEVKTTVWTMSDLVRSINVKTENAIAAGKKGLIVLLDDIHLVEPMVQKYLFEFFQNKTLQNYKIHKQALLVGAMNGKDSAGLESFLSAVINRMALYKAKFDKEFWYKYVGKNLHPYVASFAAGPNDKYFSGANSTDGASPSPRTWTELSGIIPKAEKQARGNLQTLNHLLGIMAEARVGSEAAVEFVKHVKIFQKFDFESVLSKKDPKFKVTDDISDQILMAFIIRYIKSEEDAKYLIEIINNNMDRRTFISIFVQEFDTLYSGIKDMPAGKSKDAFKKLSDMITDADEVDSDLIDIIVEGLMDVT